MEAVVHVQSVQPKAPRRRGVHSDGRAGKRTWGGRRRTGLDVPRRRSSGPVYTLANHHEDALSVREADMALCEAPWRI